MKLRIAVHRDCRNKEKQPAQGWLNIEESLSWLQGWVGAGYGWCATHFVGRHRRVDNASGSNLVVVDIDGDTTLDQFWATDTARNWCVATYTTASHTDAEHRFRALFPLGLPLTTTSQHRGAYWLVVNRLFADLGIETIKDNCGQKPERLWYGNTNADWHINSEALVPDFLLTDIDYDDPTDFVASDVTQADINRCKWLLRNFLTPSEDGEYETRYVPVMAACAAIGQPLFDDWVDWVLRGHHGEKNENIQPFKWRGLGNHSGPAKLYSLAKRQNSNWASQLPPELRFGAVGSAVGYTEFDALPNFDDVINNLEVKLDPEFEPVPDASQAKRTKGRPKRSSSDAAKEREDDVKKVKEILNQLRKNQLTGAIEYDNPEGRTIELEGNDLDLMTTKLACEHGVFIPEQRIKSAIQYAAGKNRYCPIRRYLDSCSAHAIPHKDWDRIGEVFLGNKHHLSTLAMQRMMIGAVARAYNPGCSMSWLPILVGAQGVGKSMFSRSLVPEKLFAEVSTH